LNLGHVDLFTALLTWPGISEYFFFLLAVLGLYKIRKGIHSEPRYRTWTINPCIFALVSGLLILRGVISDPLQGGAIGLLIVVGWAVFHTRFSGNA
jgi:L-type amino acid transporter 6